MFPRKRKLGSYDPEEEARLERIIFGDVSGVIDKLPEDHIEEANKSTTVYLDEVNDEDNEGDVKFQIDIVSKSSDENSDEDEQTEKKKRVWIDEDDEKYTVETAFDIQNRKISSQRPEKCYMDYLEKKYKHFVGNPKWAEINRVPDNSDDIDNEILKHSSHLETPQLKDLPKGKIDIKAMKPINQKTFSEGPKVSSLEFHPTSTLALVAGSSGILSLFQKYEVSPDGRLIALCGRLGDIYLLTSSTKELIGTLKMNTKCRTISFIDNKKLVTHGDGHEMYIWDINSRTCIHRAVDDGCLSCSVTAISPNSQYLATGSREGIVNLYDLNKLLQAKYPVPLKIVSNFVTSISALKFNPTSEILAMASDKKANAFRMLHLPSFNVFSNFPTFQTTISMPCDIDFSPSSGYLGISNLSYKAFLYRLKHYGNY
ncbi:PREDICTED: U3 small nucleolar RNA-associated protein 18 homolog isoform X2 [Polistes dominula]|uniref:U3 small nucleolar RNA-associated protein 18 homolog isoform X2 n=1 Tax=Polistes dominula TaxID=743375 RepID=A0ABM1IC17_POLDO|nr:PREDICTED: U3 small nucleolar RNA-associated protein 18 homolog isoform X2 [Polistes dominula]